MKEKILNTVLLLIEESGVSSISMRNIASELNVSATALYRHFKNKDEILLNISESGYKDLLKKLTIALAGKNSFERMQNSFLAYYKFCSENKSVFFIMNGHQLSEFSNLLPLINKQKQISDKFLIDRIEEFLISEKITNLDKKLMKNNFLYLLNGFLLLNKFDDLEKSKKEIDHYFKKSLKHFIKKIQ